MLSCTFKAVAALCAVENLNRGNVNYMWTIPIVQAEYEVSSVGTIIPAYVSLQTTPNG